MKRHLDPSEIGTRELSILAVVAIGLTTLMAALPPVVGASLSGLARLVQ